MKYLLKQRLRYEKVQTAIFLYPNQFSRWIVREANKHDLILETEYKFRGKYRIINYYVILENDFKKLLQKYKKLILDRREKFYNRSYLDQLLLILNYIFKRNNRAKEVLKRSAKYKAYNDKDSFLRLALNIAKKISNPDFKYGWGEDPAAINYEYVYYFQLGSKQVSFHSDELYLGVPEFKDMWIGYKNERFPFKLHIK